jgi:dTDP-4-dehydrorhamnose reductase
MEPIGTGRLQQRARRPSYSALTSTRLEKMGLKPMRSWREALSAYLREKAIG